MDSDPAHHPPTPTPDTKDWTWVLERACPECGFDASAVDPTEVADLVRANATTWEQLLSGDEDLVRQRPSPEVWSTAEYGAHVRDVFEVMAGRVRRMLDEDGPHYENWDQDATALEERYDLQSPADIAPVLKANADAIADLLDEVTGEQWRRPGYRGDGAAFTIASLAQYLIHDPVHHVHDARTGMGI